MSSGVNIALPAIGEQFNLDVILLSWVATSFMLTSASLLIPFGRLADIYGRKKIFVLGVIIFMVGSALCAISNSGAMLLIARGIQGIGGAATFSTCIAILTSEFPLEERGKVLGINTGAVYLGLSLGPSLGGLLTQYAGWKSIFIICAVLSLLVIIATFWKLKGVATEVTKQKFDYAGSILYTLALILTMLGVTLLSKSRTLAIWLVAGGISTILLFIWWENRNKKPLMNLTLFKENRSFTFSNLAALVNYSGTWAVSLLLSLYLQYVKGFDPKTAGLIMIASPAIQAIFSPVTGRLSDKIEPRILASTGMAVSALGIGLLIMINQGTSIVYIIACLVFLGFGFALFSSPNTNAVMSSIDRKDYGIASAMLATMRQVGMMLSMGITTVVFNLVIGQVKITSEHSQDLISSSHIIFIISTILCFFAIFASLARGNMRENGINTNGSQLKT
jgi:EmrB/QacA subfamily drug resistance transporter